MHKLLEEIRICKTHIKNINIIWFYLSEYYCSSNLLFLCSYYYIFRKISDTDDEFKKRLYTEASLLKSLNHPNIIGYRSYTHKDGVPCLFMESGDRSLDDLIEKREEAGLGPFPPFSILKVGEYAQ